MSKFTDDGDFAERLDQAMQHAGVNGITLAQRSGLSPAYVSSLKKGRRSNPAKDVVIKLANILSVNVQWLLTGEGNSPRFQNYLRELQSSRDIALREPESEQQAAFDRAIDANVKIWRSRALEAERRLRKLSGILRDLGKSFDMPLAEDVPDDSSTIIDTPAPYRAQSQKQE